MYFGLSEAESGMTYDFIGAGGAGILPLRILLYSCNSWFRYFKTSFSKDFKISLYLCVPNVQETNFVRIHFFTHVSDFYRGVAARVLH